MLDFGLFFFEFKKTTVENYVHKLLIVHKKITNSKKI